MHGNNWKKTIKVFRSAVKKNILPSVSFIAEQTPDPFKILVATMISLRTKDAVTMAASKKLFQTAGTSEEISQLSTAKIEELIYPAGFYKTKAKNIKKTAQIITAIYNSSVPSEQDKLMKLPGVGLKTANLTLNLGFGINKICVDTHVHRISNRLGWIKTTTPEQSESELMEVLPERYWIEINELMVLFGQQICRPISPFCSTCPMQSECPKINVGKNR